MRLLIHFVIGFGLMSCSTTISPKEDTAPSDTSRIKINIEPKSNLVSKLLLKASFTEPFMYAEFFEDKAVFTFPDKDTLIWNQNFDSLNFSKDFKSNGIQDGRRIEIIIENKWCTHSGSGEKWERKAFVRIDSTKYNGCAKIN